MNVPNVIFLYNADSLHSHATTGLNHATGRWNPVMDTDIIQVTFSLFCTGEGEFKACRRVGTLSVSERKVDAGNAT